MDDLYAGLRRVGAGLRFVLLSMAAGAVLTGIVVVQIATIDPAKANDQAAVLAALQPAPPLSTIMLVFLAVSLVLDVTGKAFCLAAPREAEVAGFAVATLACSGLGLVVRVLAMSSPPSEQTAALLQASVFGDIAGYFFFLRFLRRLAEFLEAPPLADRARRVLSGSTAIVAALFLTAATMVLGAAQLAMLLMLGLLIGLLIVSVSYALLVFRLWRATEAAARSAVEETTGFDQ